MDRALEVVDAVDAHANRRAARLLRRESNQRRALLHAVDVVPELAAVVDCGDVIPRAERMEPLAVDQRLLRFAAVAVAVEVPLVARDANLEEIPILAAVFLQVEPAP